MSPRPESKPGLPRPRPNHHWRRNYRLDKGPRDPRQPLPNPAQSLRRGGALSSAGHRTSEGNSQLQTPGLLTVSPGHRPPPHRSRPEPRKATPSAGTVRMLGLAAGGWGALGTPSPDTRSHTHRWEWGGILGQEPRFTGCGPWLIREKKLTPTALHKHPFT